MNEYFSDAFGFFQTVAKLISGSMDDKETIEACLFFALGIERVLKGILFDINPVYVYKNQTFKHTAPILYKSLMLPDISKNKEISSEPEKDVLTYKVSFEKLP